MTDATRPSNADSSPAGNTTDDHSIIAGKTVSGSAIRVRRGNPLRGEVRIGGSKNLALPALAASLLTAEPCVFVNVPTIEDTRTMLRLLRHLGAEVSPDPNAPGFFDALRKDRQVEVRAAEITSTVIPPDLGEAMRASFVAAGPLLARFGSATAPIPGGDRIGARPLDVTLNGLRRMGASATRVQSGSGAAWHMEAGKLEGKPLYLDYPAHTGTETLLMAAALASGTTTIVNASAEPEVVALGDMLNRMGAQIDGLGSSRISVRGVHRLRGASERIIPDRLVAGTYAIAAAITGGDVNLHPVVRDDMIPVAHKLREAGVFVSVDPDTEIMSVRATEPLRAIELQTLPFPGFPTDQQAVMAVLLTQAQGVSNLHERIYEGRLGYLQNLIRMGADITVRENGVQATFRGPSPLRGIMMPAGDIRAGASAVLAGLVADGETIVTDAWHLDRGYEDMIPTLAAIGADIRGADTPTA